MAGLKMRNTLENGGMSGRDKLNNRVLSYKNGKSYSNVKAFVRPRNPQSSGQQLVRNMFALTSKMWSQLSDAQRVSWDLEAPNWVNTDVFGDKKQSGKNLFTGVNIVLATAGKPLIEEPLTKDVLTDVNEFFFNIVSPLTITCQIDTNSIEPGEVLIVKASRQVSAGTSSVTQFTQVFSSTPDPSGTQTINLISEYSAKYGIPVQGRKIYWQLWVVGNGGAKLLAKDETVTIS
jgi:hypothetical protein